MDTDVKYGEERGASGKMSEHIMSIQDQVEVRHTVLLCRVITYKCLWGFNFGLFFRIAQELGRMEDEAQLSYLTLKQRFQRKQ